MERNIYESLDEVFDEVITNKEFEITLKENIKSVDKYRLFKLFYEITNMPDNNMCKFIV